jgi:mono/diheme cytochrome c family protein
MLTREFALRANRLFVMVLACAGLTAGVMSALSACDRSSTAVAAGSDKPRVAGPSREAIGKYLIQVGGCNDCHTAGAMEGKLPASDAEWLTGSPLGFKGPWGTTYAPNLRLKIQPYNEELFIKTFKTRDARPPMPWSALHAMNDEDLGALWAYIRSLGPGGQPAPEALPPGVEPTGPYITMAPPTIGTGGGGAVPAQAK